MSVFRKLVARHAFIYLCKNETASFNETRMYDTSPLASGSMFVAEEHVETKKKHDLVSAFHEKLEFVRTIMQVRKN